MCRLLRLLTLGARRRQPRRAIRIRPCCLPHRSLKDGLRVVTLRFLSMAYQRRSTTAFTQRQKRKNEAMDPVEATTSSQPQ